jgi:hypothetical protein
MFHWRKLAHFCFLLGKHTRACMYTHSWKPTKFSVEFCPLKRIPHLLFSKEACLFKENTFFNVRILVFKHNSFVPLNKTLHVVKVFQTEPLLWTHCWEVFGFSKKPEANLITVLYLVMFLRRRTTKSDTKYKLYFPSNQWSSEYRTDTLLSWQL